MPRVKRGVTAQITKIGALPREFVEQPAVKAPAHITVVIPVGKKAGEVMLPAFGSVEVHRIGMRRHDGIAGIQQP